MTELQQTSDSLTSAQITAKISFATSGMDTLRREENDLALAAVSGDDEAIKRIAEIRSQLRQIGEDVSILERARTVAQRKESEAAAARNQEYRARHLAIAREKAAELVKIAVRVDEAVAAFKACTVEIDRVEREIHTALREADARESGGRVGQMHLWRFAFDLITKFVKGTASFDPGRPVADVARSAWGHLLDDEGDSDE
ncbi:MAG: hypothetical protein J0I08_20800 [Rhizobiales bacterium]|nr:hypothetical protein [Hyphomicrobiales bacterium]